MGSTALSFLIEGLGASSPPEVFCRASGAWDSRARDFGARVRGLAAALSGYGLRAGACGAVLGSEGCETLRAGLAVVAAGATLVPLDPVISDHVLRRALASAGAIHAIASDERQLARLLSLRPDLPALELVLLASAAPSERKPAALLVETAVEIGAASLADDPELLRRALAESEGGTTCLEVDSAGETRPVARSVFLAMVDTIAQAVDVGRGQTLLAALPVGGVERLAASVAALSRGATLLLSNPAERPDAGLDQHPADSILLDVAGLERLHRAWTEDIGAMSWAERAAMRWALRQGAETRPHAWKNRVAEKLSLRGLRKKLGGRAARLDVFVTARDGVPSEIGMFFAATGISVRSHSPGTVTPLAR